MCACSTTHLVIVHGISDNSSSIGMSDNSNRVIAVITVALD